MNALRIAPIQRITRYVLLFKDLIKYTPDTSPDYQKFIKIHAALTKQTQELEDIRIGEETKRMLSSVNNRLLQKEVSKFIQ